jgi:DNA processing protein
VERLSTDILNERLKYEFWLSSIEGIGPRTIKQLMKYTSGAYEIYHLPPADLLAVRGIKDNEAALIYESRKTFDIEGEWEKLAEKSIHFITRNCREYPERLKQIPDAPFWLYYIGDLPPDDEMSVAVVGARACTDNGAKWAYEIGEKMADLGVSVVSGLARGIDGCSHRGTLAHGGKTFAVMGCGVDVVYPEEHWKLYEDILANGGGIISEYKPSTAPRAALFPPRNRIISGLSDVLIVVEAREKSGTLITADAALEQNRDVYALPGRIDDISSRGTNRLIKQGADIILDIDDLAADLGLRADGGAVRKRNLELKLEKEEFIVYSNLDLRSKGLEEIASSTGMSVPELTVIIMGLMDKGYITEDAPGKYRIKAG